MQPGIRWSLLDVWSLGLPEIDCPIQTSCRSSSRPQDTDRIFFSVELRLSAGNDLLILEVGLIWTSDQLVASLTRVKHPCPGGIRTLNLSRRAAADPRLRPLGHQGPSDCYDATLK